MRRIVMEYPLSEVMKFLQGEYVFVCVNKQWKAEYLRQFTDGVTSVKAVDSDERRDWVARKPQLYMELFWTSPKAAFGLFPLAKDYLSDADAARVCCKYLHAFFLHRHKRAYFSYEMDQIRGQEDWKRRAYVICLLSSVECGSLDAVAFFENHVVSLTESEQLIAFSRSCFMEDQKILFLLVNRLIPLRNAIEFSRVYNYPELTSKLRHLVMLNTIFKVGVVLLMFVLLYFIF